MWKIKRMYIASEINVQAGPYTVYGLACFYDASFIFHALHHYKSVHVFREQKGFSLSSYFKKP